MPTVRVTVISRLAGLLVGAGAPALPAPDPLPAVTFFRFQALNQTACFQASGTQPSCVPAVLGPPAESCIKDCLKPTLGPGQPVPRSGQEPRQTPPCCLVVGSGPGLRAENRGSEGRGRAAVEQVPATPAPLVTCGFDYGSSCRAGSREPGSHSRQRFPSPSFWFQPQNPRPNVACPLFLAKPDPPGASNGDGDGRGCGV